MGPVGVLDEARVQRLDALEAARTEVGGVLGRRVGEVTSRAVTRGRSAAILARPDMSISTNQFKSGNHVEVDGTIYKVVEFQHVNPGKGAAFVRTKLRRASDGAVIDRTFRAGEKLRSIRSEGRAACSSSTPTPTAAHFMNTETYEQIELPSEALKDALKWIKAGDQVDDPVPRRSAE